MSNPLLREDKFFPAGPPQAWPDGSQPGWAAPQGPAGYGPHDAYRAPTGPGGYVGPVAPPIGGVPGGTYGRPGTLGGPGTGHGAPPVPPAYDNRPGSPWPPPPAPGATQRLRRGGVASATAVLLAIICVTGIVGWHAVELRELVDGTQEVESVPVWIFGSVLVGFVLVLVAFFKPKLAPILAPIYALAEGLFVGAISKVFETYYPGIVVQAVAVTAGIFVMMLVLYATGRIRVTPRFRLGVIAATGGVMLIYLVSIVANLFGTEVPLIHESSGWGIAFSAVVVVIAALNLTLDFDFIDRAERAGAPRYLEWFAALSLVVTLVWLYLEILRLLAKLRSR